MSHRLFRLILVCLLLLGSAAPLFAQQAQGSALTYQGQLKQAGAPVNGSRAMLFRLFDAADGGTQSGPTLSLPAVLVENGVFTVPLDFGVAPFAGDGRWLEIEIDGQVLAPRQPIASAPYALYALEGSTPGPQGLQGPPGATGAISDFANFYALMPPDNAATVQPGGAISFPQDGPISTSGAITRTSASSFSLTQPGTYQVSFHVSTDEPGQLAVSVDGIVLTHTVVGRATGTSQIAGSVLVQTTSAASTLSLVAAPGNPAALTLTPLAGGSSPVSAQLVIVRLGN